MKKEKERKSERGEKGEPEKEDYYERDRYKRCKAVRSSCLISPSVSRTYY